MQKRCARRLLGVATLSFAIAGCGGGDDKQVCQPQAGNACVWAGNGLDGFSGDFVDVLDTRMYWPIDVEFAPDGTPYVLDWNNHMIRRINPDNTFETIVGTFLGDGPPDMSDLMPPGAPGLDVRLNHPTDIQFKPDGTLLFAAWHNHKIRQVDLSTNRVLVLAGRGAGFAGDDSTMMPAVRFNQPKAIELGPDGSLYISDQRNFRIRKIDPSGMITSVGGNGMAGYGGDGGAPLEAQLRWEAGGNPEPSGALAFGPDGALYVADSLNHRVRKVDFDANVITTVAGNGEAGFSGDGGPATMAQINNPRDIEFGADGRLYIADTENHRVRAVDLTAGTIETFAGSGTVGKEADGKSAKDVQLNRPFGIAFDKDGALYISDTFNSRIIRIPR